ncbi:MAG: glycine--tRNA ligase [Candidatus Colwellbacteria bacterium]|nr:glycine--tRNA ligase [Candidatus Colwellbacteria bacterium]
MEKIISLAKQRGFIFPGSEIYGGLQNAWDFGPLGTELKNNIKAAWWKRFVSRRGDMVGLEAALLMNTKVWEASGHVSNFSDPLVECEKCHHRFRADHIVEKYLKDNPDTIHEAVSADLVKLSRDIESFHINCSDCGGKLMSPQQFNLMLKTSLGATADKTSDVYFRPETAQGMFVNFKNIIDSTRKKLPFGIAQIGKAFRNEITPGNYIFRTREFEQMEIEYFISLPKKDADWERVFEEWRKEMHEWMSYLGIKPDEVHELDVPKEDLAHYSKKTIDFEYDFPFGRKELYGLAYRTDFDLRNHGEKSGANLKYKDNETGEEYYPHVIEPTFGVERSVLAAMCSAYTEETVGNSDEEESETRIVMKFPSWLAPVKVAVLPLSKKDELSSVARKLADDLRTEFTTDYDETQSIGKRYRRQDEIGTPYCVTVDFDSLNDNAVTVRDRDTMKQERIAISDLKKYLSEKLAE